MKEQNEEMVDMIFGETKFYGDRDVPYANAGEIKAVPKSMVERWLKRGGKIVADLSEEELAQMQATKQAEAKEKKTYRDHMKEWPSKADKKREEESRVVSTPESEAPASEEVVAREEQSGEAEVEAPADDTKPTHKNHGGKHSKNKKNQ